MLCVTIRVGKDRNGMQSHALGRALNPTGDFSAIGDQQPLEG
jgi:hypothetical protein